MRAFTFKTIFSCWKRKLLFKFLVPRVTGKIKTTWISKTPAKKSNIGIITGSIVAAITVLVLFLVGFFLFKRMKRNQQILTVNVKHFGCFQHLVSIIYGQVPCIYIYIYIYIYGTLWIWHGNYLYRSDCQIVGQQLSCAHPDRVLKQSAQTTTRVVGFALLLKDIHTHNIYIYIVKS